MKKTLRLLASITLALALAACGSDGPGGIFDISGSGAASAGASPSLGLVQNATVNFYQADDNTLIGSSDTGTTGVVQVNSGSYSGPVIVEVLGDNIDAMYFDEAAGALVPFPAGSALHALVPNATSTVGVTPLTELAYQAALAQNLIPISASAVNQLNEAVRSALAPGLNSLLSVPTLIDSNTTAGSLADNEAGRYALVLAALAELNSGNSSPALTTLNALVADLADGVVDGQNNGSPVQGAGYGANFIMAMTTALNAAANNFANAALQSNAASQAPANTQVDTSGISNGGGGGNTGGTPNGNTTPATVNPVLVGTFDLTYSEANPGAPFTDGQMVQVIVGSDNSLQLPGGTTLTNPFFRIFGSAANEAEVIWLDSANNLEYALSDNSSGTFNEINVGSTTNPQSTSGIPGFLGQLRMDNGNMGGGSTPPPELAAIAGQFMGTVVSKNGDFSPQYTLDQMILVNIDSNSVITVDNQFTFDPADMGYSFQDNRNNQSESFYRVQVGDSAEPVSFDVIFEDANNNTPIAYRLRMVENLGGGSFRISTLELEERPLPAEVTTFFGDMIGDSPVSLTGVSADQGFNSPFDVCDQLSLVSDNGATVNSSNSRTPFRYRLEQASDGLFRDSEIYRLSNTRYADSNGDASLQFPRNRIVRRADGFIDFVSTDAQNNDRAVATNDPSQIMAAGCGGMMGGNGDAALGASENGMSASVDGTQVTITSSSTYNDRMNGFFGVNLVDNNGNGGAQRRWTMQAPLQTGSHSCAFSQTNNTEISLFDGQEFFSASADSGCTINVTSIEPTLEATFSGMAFVQRQTLQQVAITGGMVRLPAPNQSGGGNTGGQGLGSDDGASGMIDGATETVTEQVLVQEGNGYIQISARQANPQRTWNLQLPAAVGTYQCASTPSMFVQFLRDVGGNDELVVEALSNTFGNGSCTITVTAIDANSIEGTFSGVLLDNMGNEFPASDGEFRADRT